MTIILLSAVTQATDARCIAGDISTDLRTLFL
jgi:hypothetical protein